MSAEREFLPNRRPSENFEFTVDGGKPYTAEVGYYSDGRPAELFLNAHKRGGRADVDARDAAILLSFALQHGATLDALAPAMTRNPDGSPQGLIGTVIDIVRVQS